MRRTLASALVLLGVLGTLAGCTADDPAEEVTPTLRVGIHFSQPGIGLMQDGVPRGFDVDVAAYVAWKLGHSPYAIEWVEAVYEHRDRMLADGEVDLLVATYSITAERDELVDFAGPYLVAGQDLLVRADETAIAGVEDLAGRAVCAVVDTTTIDRLRTLLGTDAEIVAADEFEECTAQLLAGTVDAASSDDLILAGHAATDELFGKVRLVGSTVSEEPLGIGLPQGNRDLCEKVSAALVDMVADGSWQKFIDRHTGGTGYTPKTSVNPPTPRPCA